jgi:putative N6-adenine-specific DNA methylase
LEEDRLTLSLDSSGDNLYRRGFKTHAGTAPLRETLAAAVLLLAGYQPDRPLVDPLCGSGTFSLEAALIVKHIPPGLQRTYAFMAWPAFRPGQWHHWMRAAEQRIGSLAQPLIFASDISSHACGGLTECLQCNELQDAVRVDRRDFFDMHPETQLKHLPPGLVVLNPPYHRRLTTGGRFEDFYARLGVKLRNDFSGWRAAVLIPRADLAGLFPMLRTAHPMAHGGLNLVLLMGKID